MRLSPYKGKANKRFTATFKDGTTTHFGQMRNPTTKQRTVTFIDGGSEEKKAAYLARHSKSKGEDWNDYKSAGALSRHLLWKSKSLTTNLKEYKKRFNL